MSHYVEFRDVLGVQSKAKESAKRYAGRVAKALDAADDEIKAKLSDEALDWLNKQTKAEFAGTMNETGGITPPAKEPEPVIDPALVVGDAIMDAVNPKAKTRPAGKPTVVKAKPAPKAKEPGTSHYVKVLVLEDPKATPDDIKAKLDKLGVKSTRGSIQTIRADFLHSMKVLKDLGKLK